MALSKYPKQVYIIFPFDENQMIAGAYVGASAEVNRRIQNHLNDKKSVGKQQELHELMRSNGFKCIIVDEITNHHDNHIEYDWMDYCENKLKFELFNNQVGLCGADWRRIGGEAS